MSTRMLKMVPTQRAWLGGVLSCFGQFDMSRTINPRMELQIRSIKHPEMVSMVAQMLGITLRKKKSGHEVIVAGDELEMLWPLITEYVTSARNVEYEAVKAEVARRRAAYADKLAYQAERAAAPRSTPDTLRRRDEALYHNQDPAVQVVDGFVEAEMAVQYDLDQARIAREKATAEMTKGHVKR